VQSLIHTICSSLQQILSLLSLLCLHQSPLLSCSHSQLTSYSSDCCLKIQRNSHNYCPDSHTGSHLTPTSYFSPLNYFKNALLLLQLLLFIDSAETAQETPFFCYIVVYKPLPTNGHCLFVSWLLPSNGCICQSITSL
jgi:hypothetical protein